MGHGYARVPLWCVFGAAITAILLICAAAARISDANWFLHSAKLYETEAKSWRVQLENWERDTVLEYSPKLSSAASRSQPPQIRYYEFNISSQLTYIGGVRREILAINGKYPGPLVETVEGDTLVVNVANLIESTDSDAGKATSIHFHGQLMNGTNYYDGSVGLTQCGIPPGKNFTYRFVTSRPGTFWYHSHWDLQQIKGLVGPMITHERNKVDHISNEQEPENHARDVDDLRKYEELVVANNGLVTEGEQSKQVGWSVKDERSKENNAEIENEEPTQEAVLLLSDLYNRPAQDLLLDFMEPWIGGTEEPVPDIALAQGKTQPVIELSKGGKVRLRIINACSYTAFHVELEGGLMSVIEADSTPTMPTSVQKLLVYPAQRYSIVVDLKGKSSAWLHSIPQRSLYGSDLDMSDSLHRSSGSLRTLLVVQNKTANEPLLTKDTQVNENELFEPYFEPLKSDIGIKEASSEYIIDISMTRMSSGEIAGALNNRVQKRLPNGSLLGTILRDLELIREQNTAGIYEPYRAQTLLNIDEIETIDLVIRNFDDGPHPVHLHGHRVWVVSRGNLTSIEPTWVPLKPLNRDTVWLPEGQWVRLRLVADNPGLWAIHCHIPWHSIIGMKGAMLALPSKMIRQKKPPPNWYSLCQGL